MNCDGHRGGLWVVPLGRRNALLVAAAALSGQGQLAAATTRRLGVLLYDSEASWAFLRRDLPPALARLGWQEGRNLAIDWRFADGHGARLPGLAQRSCATVPTCC